MKDSIYFQYDKAKFNVSMWEKLLLLFVKSRCYFGKTGGCMVLVRAKKMFGRFYIVRTTSMEDK